MKALTVSLAAAAFLNPAPAGASTMTIGSSLARSCFEAAQARQSRPDGVATCDRALGEEALDRHDRAATLVNRGILHLGGGRFAYAGRDFDAAIVVNPAEPEAWLNKAILSVKTEQSAAVFGLIGRALALNTRRPALAYYVRGLAHEEAGNLRAAYADLVRARDLAPEWDDPATELRRYRVR